MNALCFASLTYNFSLFDTEPIPVKLATAGSNMLPIPAAFSTLLSGYSLSIVNLGIVTLTLVFLAESISLVSWSDVSDDSKAPNPAVSEILADR